MTLNVPEAEEQARTVQRRFGDSDMCSFVEAASTAEDFLALAALAQELAALLDRNDDEMYADERHALLAKARAAGLLPVRESIPLDEQRHTIDRRRLAEAEPAASAIRESEPE